jgi:hypothetical protein
LAAAALLTQGCTAAVVAQQGGRQDAAPSTVVTLRPDALAFSKARVRERDGQSPLASAFRRLIRDADSALRAPLVSVTDKKTLLPPSGDRHDYFSLSPYWWPDPAKKDGLPYIRRDGETNPESKRDLDQPRVAALGWNLQSLALAYYFTGDEKYAARATAQIRRWFLDPATRMTPHLRFAQLVRGIDRERGSGIIDTRWFIETVDAAGLLQGSRHWTAADQQELRKWFRGYLDWLLASPNGRHEQVAKNNHGSWFAAQTATYALFVGDSALARRIVEGAKPRIGWQIKPDGSQPIELERTRSMHYSGFNVEALSRVAEIGRSLGVDLWNYQAPEGGSLRRAIDNLAKYTGTDAKWPGQQIDAVDPDLMVIHFRRARIVWHDPAYDAVLQRLPGKVASENRSALLYPPPK